MRSMEAVSNPPRLNRAFLARFADWLVVGVAVALPWSTSATGILIALWLMALLPTLDAAAIKRELATTAGGLPVALWCLGAVGMLWANVDWTDRLGGLDGFNRLLAIPLLLTQFRRSERGGWVLLGFFVSTASVLLVSFVLVLAPGVTWRGSVVPGVPVHDTIFQGAAFLISAFGALGYAGREAERRRWRAALTFTAIAALYLANFAVTTISRISLVVAPALAGLLGWRIGRWKGLLGACLVGVAIGAALWLGSSSLRVRMNDTVLEIDQYLATDKATSLGMHAAFLKESLAIVAAAPLIGHGTGSISGEFRRMTAGETGAAGVVTANPHNQTFAVAIQLGTVGALVLWAMWIAHLVSFRGSGLAAWFGTVVVVENMISSTAHSHLFDFNNGWLYVFGVGVLGGMTLRERKNAIEPV